MKKYYGKTWAKIIVWICALVSLNLSILFGFAVFLDVTEYVSDDFYESGSVQATFRITAYDTIWRAYHQKEIGTVAQGYQGITLTDFSADGQKSSVLVQTGETSGKYHVQLYDYQYEPESDFINLEISEDMSEPPVFLQEAMESGSRVYTGKAAIYVSDPPDKDSVFYENWQFYQKIQPYLKAALPGLCVSAVILICAVLWLFGSAGHTADDDEIHLILIDRIPCEITALFALTLTAVLFPLAEELTVPYARSYPSGLRVLVPVVSVCVNAGFLILMCAMLSFARRIKAKQLLSTSLIAWVLKKTGEFIRIIPLTPKVSLCAAVLFALNFIAILAAPQSLFHLAVVAADLLAAASMPVYAYFAQQLEKRTAAMSKGDLSASITGTRAPFAPSFYRDISADLDRISEGIEAAVEKQLKAERLKTELITNVSHDIRTPLTSIISYTDLLSRESDEVKKTEYLEALKRNSERLRKLSEDLIEASKASTGNIHANLEKTDLREMIEQALGEYEEKLAKAQLNPVMNIKDEPLYAMADGRLLWRVMSNLLSNCVKYAQPHTRVYIDTARQDDGHVSIVIKNISKDILNISSEELMERFVRGDASRSSEGSGLGLNIAESLCTIMNGSFEISVDGDLFKTCIILPAAE